MSQTCTVAQLREMRSDLERSLTINLRAALERFRLETGLRESSITVKLEREVVMGVDDGPCLRVDVKL